MSKQKDAEAYNKIKKAAIKTRKQLKQLKKDCDRDNPVDMDIIKTTKAMFYEEIITIIKNNKESEK